MTIWKIGLDLGENHLTLPNGAEVMHVHDQDRQPCIWIRVDPEAKRIIRTFTVIGTGAELPGGIGDYLGTAHCGVFVWHVFGDRA